MVQVDVFWSYAIGAGFATAAGRQLKERAKKRKPRLEDPYLLANVLFLALIFAPSGLYLVWEFPSWETMHVGDRSMPAWLVTLFAVTNVSQGILGYFVVEWLIARGRGYLAYLQVMAGYFAMFFILVHGWDGEGYQRFFSESRADYESWSGDWTAWLTSDVALSLLGMGVVLVPVMLGLIASWMTRGARLADPDSGARALSPAGAVAAALATVFGGGLGLAVASSLLLHALGTIPGALASIVLIAAVLWPGSLVYRLYLSFGFPDLERREAASPATALPEPSG
jgi:hypothetical protein